AIVPVGSNTERVHKRYAGHHTKTRNRLSNALVDNLVRAKLSISARNPALIDLESQEKQALDPVGKRSSTSRDIRPDDITSYLCRFKSFVTKDQEDTIFNDERLLMVVSQTEQREEEEVR